MIWNGNNDYSDYKDQPGTGLKMKEVIEMGNNNKKKSKKIT